MARFWDQKYTGRIGNWGYSVSVIIKHAGGEISFTIRASTIFNELTPKRSYNNWVKPQESRIAFSGRPFSYVCKVLRLRQNHCWKKCNQIELGIRNGGNMEHTFFRKIGGGSVHVNLSEHIFSKRRNYLSCKARFRLSSHRTRDIVAESRFRLPRHLLYCQLIAFRHVRFRFRGVRRLRCRQWGRLCSRCPLCRWVRGLGWEWHQLVWVWGWKLLSSAQQSLQLQSRESARCY